MSEQPNIVTKEEVLALIKNHYGSASIIVRVTPGARREALFVRPEKTLGIKVAAPAVENRANERLIELLSKSLKIPKSAISIGKGAHTKNKEIIFSGFSSEKIAERIYAVISKHRELFKT